MIVQVNQGKLQGVQKTSSLTGKPFCSFLGIPYAKPPVGDLRFRAPEPAESWDGIRDATEDGNPCTQKDIIFSEEEQLIGSEDCLTLNVHTPEPPSQTSAKKPVMVFIHGGGFFQGSASSVFYGADFLMNYGIVYVAINYRLHALGFLNMSIPSCPGNAGMKDQVLALKWIKENIESFGGDPDNITIFGESAGASAVHFHMLSPASEGLFNKAIAQSGNAFSPWAITHNPSDQGFKLGEILGFKEKNPEKLVEFLKKIPAEEVLVAVHQLHENNKKEFPGICAPLSFTPSVEIIKENAFLPDLPENLRSTAKPVPFLTGLNDQEGVLLLLAYKASTTTALLGDLSLVIRNNFDFTEPEVIDVVKKVEEFYFQSDDKITKLEQLFNVYTDLYFRKFYQSYDYIMKSGVPVYLYEFSFDGSLNAFKNIALKSASDLIQTIEGAAHADELAYLFGLGMFKDEPKIEESDRKVIENICSLWTNFAKTGNPTQEMTNIEWKASTTEKPYYLKIDENLQLIPGKIMEKRLTFWNEVLTATKYSRCHI